MPGRAAFLDGPSEMVSIYMLPIHFNKLFTGSHGGGAHLYIDIPRIVGLVKDGRVSFDGIITSKFPLDETSAALDVCTVEARGGRC